MQRFSQEWRDWLDRNGSRLMLFARQQTRCEADAEDVLQEGFLYLWDRAKNFDPSRAKAFTWATMIFRHKAIDLYLIPT